MERITKPKFLDRSNKIQNSSQLNKICPFWFLELYLKLTKDWCRDSGRSRDTGENNWRAIPQSMREHKVAEIHGSPLSMEGKPWPL